MASVSASHLIIFIASLVIAAGVVGTLTTGVDRLNSAIDDRSLDVSQQVRMDMAFVSDPGATYSDSPTFHVRNTGSQGVPIDDASQFDIVFNGEFIPSSDVTISDPNNGGDSTWRPNEVIAITVDRSLADGDNRLYLSVNEDEELFEFRT